MRSPYRAILIGYAVRWQSWFVLALWLCQFAAYLLESLGRRGRGGLSPMVPVVMLGVVYAGGAIGAQAKEHLAAYRAAVVPGFRAPHLAVAAGLLALAVLPFPTVALVTGGPALPVLGVGAVLGALAFAAFSRGGWRVTAFFVLCLGLLVPAVSRALSVFLAERYPAVSLALIVAAAWLLADALRFLGTMDEETPGYELQFRGSLRPFSGPQARRHLFAAVRDLDRRNSFWLRTVDAQIPDSMPYVGNSRWRRLAHWRRAQANWRYSSLMPTLVWLLMLVLHAGFGSGGAAPNGLLRPTLWVLVMLPSFVGLGFWQSRAGMLGRELTYPLRRRDFVLEQGASILFSQYAAWLVLVVAMAAALALVPCVGSWADLAAAVAVTAPWNAILLAVVARLGSLGSGLPMLAALTLGAGAGTGLLLSCLALADAGVTLAVTVALAATAAAGLAAVYRHWLHADIA